MAETTPVEMDADERDAPLGFGEAGDVSPHAVPVSGVQCPTN
ncbi:hypothetical protein [Haloarcula sp. JP-L23]